MVATITRDSTLAYTLIVLPLFVLMGNLVAGAGISGDLFRAGQALIGRRRGGVAMATVAACGAFGAICGSSVATAATMGKVAIPEMRRLGYDDRLASAAVAAGGTLGILIPPSVIMVVYGVATQTHIGMLFAAGIVPGIIADPGATCWPCATRSGAIRRRPRSPARTRAVDGRTLVRTLWPVAAIFALVMGGIYGGVFTSVEASGIGAAAALLFALTRHNLTLRQIREIFVDSAQTSAMMFAIILGAAMFGEFVNLTGVHEGLLALVKDSGLSPFGVILVLIAIYLLLGCVLESLSMILLTVPIFFPVVTALGFDPVWFGILVVVVVEIGLITPPIGVNLFVIRSVTPDITMSSVIRGVLPLHRGRPGAGDADRFDPGAEPVAAQPAVQDHRRMTDARLDLSPKRWGRAWARSCRSAGSVPSAWTAGTAFPAGFSWITIGFRASPPAGEGEPLDLILRIGDPRGLLAPYRAAPEFRAMEALQAVAQLPVPVAHAFSDDASVIGAPFLVTGRVEGDTPDALEGRRGAARPRAQRQPRAGLRRRMAALHGWTGRRTGLRELWGHVDAAGVARSQVAFWWQHAHLDRPGAAVPPQMHHAMRWLDRHAPAAPRVAIVHGDYRVGNFLQQRRPHHGRAGLGAGAPR